MASSTDCWGIEVGANAIKAIRLRRSGGQVSIADFEVIPFKKVLTTPDIDVDEQVRVGLDQFISRHPIGKSTVIVSVPGHMAFARFAKLPPVEPKKIPDIVKFEAVQQIPFPIEQVQWDYQTFQAADSPDVEVGIFAITKDRLLPWLTNFEHVNMPVHAVVLSPVAILNAMMYDRGLDTSAKGTIVMDIGTQATDLIIIEGGRAWLRTIPIGGNHFTDALVRSFKLSFSKAEKLKREAATSKYARQIFQAMRPVFVDLVQEVQKSLGYYQSLNRDAALTQLLGLGSTFRLPGLQTFLKQQLQMDIERLDTFQKIAVDDRKAATFAENVPVFSPAYGLALAGLGLEKVSCNLLPMPVIRRQVWKAKQPWFMGAAAVAVGGAVLAYTSVMLARGQYNSSDNLTKREQVKTILARAEESHTKWRNVEQQNDPRGRIGNINRVLDYRDVWPVMMRDIDRAIAAMEPQPAVIAGDLAEIAKIPREKRRMIFIESLTSTYEYATREPGKLAPADDAGWKDNAPSFRIRLTGTTPFEDASAFIDNGFNKYLRNTGERAGFPYHIDPRSVSIVSISRITEVTPPGGPGGPAVPARPVGGGFPGAFPGAAPGGFPGAFPGAAPGGVASPTQQTVEAAFLKLLPKPLLSAEPRAGDTRFVIEWKIQLKPPGSARLNAATPAEPPAPAEPSAPAPKATAHQPTESDA